MFKLKKK